MYGSVRGAEICVYSTIFRPTGLLMSSGDVLLFKGEGGLGG